MNNNFIYKQAGDKPQSAFAKFLSKWLYNPAKQKANSRRAITAANIGIAGTVGSIIDANNYKKDNDLIGGKDSYKWLANNNLRYIPGVGAINTLADYAKGLWTGEEVAPGRMINTAITATTVPVGIVSGNKKRILGSAGLFATDGAVTFLPKATEGVNAYIDSQQAYKDKLSAEQSVAEKQLKLLQDQETRDAARLEAERKVERGTEAYRAKKQEELLATQISNANKQMKLDKWKTILALGGGALALGGAGYALYKWLGDREEERASRTRMKMRIDTPDGKDAIVDVPIVNPDLSGKLAEEFNKGVTRTVRRTARHNSIKRDPETGKMIPYPEWHKKYPNGVPSAAPEGLPKAARLINMPQHNLVDGTVDAFPAKSIEDESKASKVRNFLDSFELNKQASTIRPMSGAGVSNFRTGPRPTGPIKPLGSNTKVNAGMPKQPQQNMPKPVTNTGAPQQPQQNTQQQNDAVNAKTYDVSNPYWRDHKYAYESQEDFDKYQQRLAAVSTPEAIRSSVQRRFQEAGADMQQRKQQTAQTNTAMGQAGIQRLGAQQPQVQSTNIGDVNGKLDNISNKFEAIGQSVQPHLDHVDDFLSNNRATEAAIRKQNPNASDVDVQRMTQEAVERDRQNAQAFAEWRRQQAMNKQAAGRDTQAASLSEILGGVTAPAISGIAAGVLANKKLGLSPMKSALLGIGTSIATPLMGMTAAALTPNRTLQEQADHDTGHHGLLNAIIPGYAQFNQVQRANMIAGNAQSLKQIDQAMTAATGSGYDKPEVKNKASVGSGSSMELDDEDDY